MFDNIKDAMTFAKGERTAIIVLAAVILLIIAANFFVAKRPSNVNFYLHNLDSIMVLHESAISSQRSAISSQRSAVSSQRSAVSSQQSVVSKEEAYTSKVHQQKTNSQKSITNVHINSADTLELQSLPGIGSFFAKNIVSYREKLGGFIETNQLLEVYAFDSARLEMIESYLIIDTIETRKIKINHDDFKTILRHPYIEYEDVKKIVKYRESKGMITNWEKYLKVVGRDDIDKRLIWYLDF